MLEAKNKFICEEKILSTLSTSTKFIKKVFPAMLKK
jgi:hypothetical protein